MVFVCLPGGLQR